MSRPILITAVAVAFAGAGAAQAAERNFPAGDFHAVSNSTPFDVYVHTGKAPSVHASGSDEALNRLEIETRGGELHIGTKSGSWFSGWHWGRGEHLRIDVTAPMIGEVSLAGEVRSVAHAGLRLKEAAKLGFVRGFGPADSSGSEGAGVPFHAIRMLPNLVDRIMGAE